MLTQWSPSIKFDTTVTVACGPSLYIDYEFRARMDQLLCRKTINCGFFMLFFVV